MNQFARTDQAYRIALTRRSCMSRYSCLAPVLDTATSAILHFDFKLQIKIFRLKAAIDDVSIADRMFFRGDTHDGPILNVPKGWVAVPILQTRAVKDTDKPSPA